MMPAPESVREEPAAHEFDRREVPERLRQMPESKFRRVHSFSYHMGCAMLQDTGIYHNDSIRSVQDVWGIASPDLGPDDASSGDETTMVLQQRAVERVILRMREKLDKPLSLNEMAEIAHLSRFHFNRVFSSITGVSPRKFLATLRLEHAKRLLLTTDMSITEVCYDTGYSSLGTFTSHFTDLVGVTPRRWRQLREDMKVSMDEIASLVQMARERAARTQGASIAGTVAAPEGFRGLMFIGLFKSNVPQSHPCTGDMLLDAGTYHMPGVSDGTYFNLAVAIDWPLEPLNFFVPDRMLRGRCGPIVVENGAVTGNCDLVLRAAHLTDPPILIALPYLFVEYLKIGTASHA